MAQHWMIDCAMDWSILSSAILAKIRVDLLIAVLTIVLTWLQLVEFFSG